MDRNHVNILFLGDVIGDPGRKALFLSLSSLIKEKDLDFVVVNGENAAGGFGVNAEVTGKLYSYGVDCITTGNHVWRNKDVFSIIDDDHRLIRPANYPGGTPGRGWAVLEKNGVKIGVLNLLCRVFMEPLECPFRTARKEVANIRKQTKIVIVDLHGEATSEKMAMGWYLDGTVSAVIGTHTHVATCDARVSPQGTAYITDVGMTGPVDSILGVQPELVIERFLTRMPNRFEVASGAAVLQAVLLDIDPLSGRAGSISRLEECSDE